MGTPRRVLRLPMVIEITGYSRSAIYHLMANNSFPKQRKIGPRAVGWDSHEIEEWVNNKLGGANDD